MLAAFVWPVRVYYEDTDTAGLVYHANYLKFLERARTEWLRAAGFEQQQLMNDERVAFSVRSMAIEFLKPAQLDDVLQVSVNVLKLGRASIQLQQAITRESGLQLCTARVKIACIDVNTLKPRGIPNIVMQELKHAG